MIKNTNVDFIGLAVAIGLAGCATLAATREDWNAYNPQPAKPDSSSLECKLLQASRCAYQITKDSVQDPGFCNESLGNGDAYGLTDNKGRDAVLIKHIGNDVVIAFRGTIPDVKDWKNDFNAKPVQDVILGNVHKGFQSSLNNLWPGIQKVLATTNHNGNIYLTGHSKGGAIAMLAALRFQQEININPKVITFAAARAVEIDSINKYSDIQILRYENQGDVVPHLPPNADEINAFREFKDEDMDMEKRGVYQSTGQLRYITSDLQIIAPEAVSASEFDNKRVTTFSSLLKLSYLMRKE